MVAAPPPLRALAEAFDRLFLVEPGDRRFVLLRSQVSRAVAAFLRVRWTPRLGGAVAAVAVAAGAVQAVRRKCVYLCIRPRHLEADDALRRSRTLCQALLKGAAPDPMLVEEARRSLDDGSSVVRQPGTSAAASRLEPAALRGRVRGLRNRRA